MGERSLVLSLSIMEGRTALVDLVILLPSDPVELFGAEVWQELDKKMKAMRAPFLADMKQAMVAASKGTQIFAKIAVEREERE